jgi:hypothetical protein
MKLCIEDLKEFIRAEASKNQTLLCDVVVLV